MVIKGLIELKDEHGGNCSVALAVVLEPYESEGHARAYLEVPQITTTK